MKKGFTLIELLVVVLIIGILSSIALPQYTAAVEKARLAEALTTVKYIKDQMKIRYMECGEECMEDFEDYLELTGGTWVEEPSLPGYNTKNFSYTFPSGILVSCSDYEIGNEDTALSGWKAYLDSGTAMEECRAYTDLGYKICKSIENQYDLADYREE